MAAHVVSFRRREMPFIDWTRDELAELYRIEHALVQTGLSLEIERGMSDEGDPWFVFCRPDGEVLVHLTRYDGYYRLYSPALPSALIGRSFAELTKSFSDQIPLYVTVQRGGDARLFVHPAAMLAVVIGTIFIASNDIALSPQSSETNKKSADGSELIAGHNLKALLQASFQSYLDNFLGWLRDGATFQQSSYLNLISAVAAFIVGSTATLNFDHGLNESSLDAHSDIVDQTEAPDSVLLAVLPTEASHDAARANGASTQDQGAIAKGQYGGDSDNDPSSVNKFVSVTLADASQRSDISNGNGIEGDNEGRHLANTDSLVTSAEEFNTFNQFLTDSNKLRVDLVHSSDAASSATATASDALHDLLTSLAAVGQDTSNGSNSDINWLVAHAVRIDTGSEGAGNLFSFFLTSNQIMTNGQQFEDSFQTATTAHYPLFDDNAAAILLDFLRNNPNARAVFDNKSIVVYDEVGDSHDTQVNIHAWEFTDGSTIVLVGHVDHSFVA